MIKRMVAACPSCRSVCIGSSPSSRLLSFTGPLPPQIGRTGACVQAGLSPTHRVGWSQFSQHEAGPRREARKTNKNTAFLE